MTVKELITELSKFDENLEVSITDGFNCYNYHTDNIFITEYQDDECGRSRTLVDIGIGGNLI